MRYDQIMVRYGELSTKGKNRKLFVAKLKKSVKNVLSGFDTLEIYDPNWP